MKKILVFLLMAMAVNVVQAQTCAISANKNRGKVVQISVDLDSLKGQTLVTTINPKNGKLIVQMAYDSDSLSNAAIVSREDSTENIIAENEILNDTTAFENSETEISDSINTDVGSFEAEEDEISVDQQPKSESLLNIFGVGEVASLIEGFAKTNGEEYAEYLTQIMEADTTKYKPEYKQRKWKWLKNYKSYTTLELSGIWGKDFGNDDEEVEEDIDAEDFGTDPEKGFNFGGSAKISQVFVSGHYDANGKFIPNPLNFAWSIGALFAMDYQKDYGWSYDFLAKIGIQAGNGITLGGDILLGPGITPYAIYSTNYVNYRVVMHNQLCFKYGIQGWVSMNYSGNTYTSIFARLVKSVVPSSINNHPTPLGWKNVLVDFDEGSWQIGAAIGYKFGYNPDMESRRLYATMSTGYNLFGGEKAWVSLIELEKFNQVSPQLDFIYGIGYGHSLDDNNLNSFTLNGGWKYRPQSTGKLAYLAKLYAGVGEYMVEKNASKDYFQSNAKIKHPCLKGGVQAGIGCELGCMHLSASIRAGYHYGFDTDSEGFEKLEMSNLQGFELTPVIGVGINF